MKQATLINPQEIVINEVPVPIPTNNQIQIKVAYNGICGSDIHAYYGKHPFISTPITMGHEFSGTVTQVGEKVKNVVVGDKVTSMPQIYCGKCELCLEGRYNICESLAVIGCQTAGAASNYFVFDESLVKKVPAEMSLKHATMIEPVAVGIHAVKRTEVKDKNVLVLGAGTIGNFTAQAALTAGAKNVIITDLSEYRLQIAKESGIANTIINKGDNLANAIKEIFGKDYCDVAFECVGIGATVNQAIRFSQKGRDIVIVGVFGDIAEVDMALVQDKELRLIGSLMYIEEDYDDTIKYISEEKIKVDPLITKAFPFEEYKEAFDYIENNQEKSMKILIEFE